MMVLRKEYLEKLAGFRDKKIIKVITGVRRCGKSTLLRQFQEYLLGLGIEEKQIISINFEDLDYEELTDYKKLHSYVRARMLPDKMNYIFLDEIQNVNDFPKAVDSLYLRENADIYITGSNAYMLSGEIATFLSGRYVQFEMLPFSFKEYLEAVGSGRENPAADFTRYIETSSFPYAPELRGDAGLIRDYLEGIYSTIVIKDIMSRRQISDAAGLHSLLRFVFDNIGNPLSAKKIADTMTSAGRKTDPKTVDKYLDALEESYIIYKAKRYDIKGKQYLRTQDKYYVVDPGLRHMLLGQSGMDTGRILENVCYLELLRRGYQVYVGKIGELEVDFAAVNGEGVSYFQVALTVRDEKTLERELRSLKMIKNHYPKFLLTLDEDPEAHYDGIRRKNAVKWLME